MRKKVHFEILRAQSHEIALPTKFGGQPAWINAASWPYTPMNDRPMKFLGQIVLPEAVFPGALDAVVYIFLPDVDRIYEEGVVIIIQNQDYCYKCSRSNIKYSEDTNGPSIFEWDNNEDKIFDQTYHFEFSEVEIESDLSIDDLKIGMDLDLAKGYNFRFPEVAGNKLGGLPLYYQWGNNPPEHFTSDDWLLLLQLAPKKGYYLENYQPNFYPFHMDLGNFGILSIFISKDYTQAVAYVQQP